MDENGIGNINEIRGVALKELKSFDNIMIEPKTASLKEDCDNVDCNRCVACCGIYEAISRKEDGIAISMERCAGCGLCRYVCPDGRIVLVRR